MIISFIFTKQAKKAFLKLPPGSKKRILEKLKQLKYHPDIFSVIRRLNDFDPATHRLRIGSFRLILKLTHQDEKTIKFYVLDAGHRRDIYA